MRDFQKRHMTAWMKHSAIELSGGTMSTAAEQQTLDSAMVLHSEFFQMLRREKPLSARLLDSEGFHPSCQQVLDIKVWLLRWKIKKELYMWFPLKINCCILV